MKEDYLWDKTGAVDPEIERLENALAVFRYVDTEPPALPAKIIPSERKTPRGFFRLALAFAACAALAAVCLGVWFQFSSGKIEVAEDSAENAAPPVENKIPAEIPLKQRNDLIVEKTEMSKRPAEPKITKIRKIVLPIVHQNKTIARNVEAKKPTVKLTKDEEYAYNQLLLALSITGSKLKLVTDKIDRVEEKNAVLENGR